MRLYGRRRIFTDYTEINEGNIVKVLSDALQIHRQNAFEVNLLRWYVRGEQGILKREKKVRKDVCNKTVVNVAQECLDFTMGFTFGEPVQFSRREGSGENDGVSIFNGFMVEQGKDDVDQDLANDFCIAGVGYRVVFPNPDASDESPFILTKLDPETTFCVYSNDMFKRKVLGVSYCVHSDNTITYTAYTDTLRFELTDSVSGGLQVRDVSRNGLNVIPIVEYTAPDASGIFERAIPLLESINVLASNRLDDIEQFVASILWIHNADMSDEDLARIDELLAVRTNSSGDGQQAILKYLSTPLDQTSVETLEKSLEEHVYELCGVPGRVQSSGGSTGEAAALGEAGWRKIEYISKRREAAWKKGEREMVKVILAIFDCTTSLPSDVKSLKPTDFKIDFIRAKNYNMLTKTQSVLNLLNAGVHPRDAYTLGDVFPDPEQAYRNAEEGGYIKMALERMGGNVTRETGDVTNQPKGDGSMNQAINGKGTIQKRD